VAISIFSLNLFKFVRKLNDPWLNIESKKRERDMHVSFTYNRQSKFKPRPESSSFIFRTFFKFTVLYTLTY
jgi:hypothetical protein